MYVRYRRSCSWMCLRPRLCWAAPSVSNHCHSRMLDLGLQLDLPVSGGLVEDDHHARSREDGIFRHLVAVTVHVTFVYRCCHTFYSCTPFHICHVRRPPWLIGWPKFGISCILWDVAGCIQVAFAVHPAYSGSFLRGKKYSWRYKIARLAGRAFEPCKSWKQNATNHQQITKIYMSATNFPLWVSLW